MRNKIWIIVLSCFFLINSFLLFGEGNPNEKIEYKIINNTTISIWKTTDIKSTITATLQSDNNWKIEPENLKDNGDWRALISEHLEKKITDQDRFNSIKTNRNELWNAYFNDLKNIPGATQDTPGPAQTANSIATVSADTGNTNTRSKELNQSVVETPPGTDSTQTSDAHADSSQPPPSTQPGATLGQKTGDGKEKKAEKDQSGKVKQKEKVETKVSTPKLEPSKEPLDVFITILKISQEKIFLIANSKLAKVSFTIAKKVDQWELPAADNREKIFQSLSLVDQNDFISLIKENFNALSTKQNDFQIVWNEWLDLVIKSNEHNFPAKKRGSEIHVRVLQEDIFANTEQKAKIDSLEAELNKAKINLESALKKSKTATQGTSILAALFVFAIIAIIVLISLYSKLKRKNQPFEKTFAAIEFHISKKYVSYCNVLEKFRIDLIKKWEDYLKEEKISYTAQLNRTDDKKAWSKFSRIYSHFKNLEFKRKIFKTHNSGKISMPAKELQLEIESLLSGLDFSSKLDDLKTKMFDSWKDYFDKVGEVNKANAEYCNLGKEVQLFYNEVIMNDNRFKDAKDWCRLLYNELKNVETKPNEEIKKYIEKAAKDQEQFQRDIRKLSEMTNARDEIIKSILLKININLQGKYKEAELLEKYSEIEKHIVNQKDSIESQREEIEAKVEEVQKLNKAIVEKDKKIENEKGKNENLELEKISLQKSYETLQKEKEKWEEIEKSLSMKMSHILQRKIIPALLLDKWSEIEIHIGGLNVQIRGLQTEKNIWEELKKFLSSKMDTILPEINKKTELMDKWSGIEMHIGGLNVTIQNLNEYILTLKGQVKQKEQEIENKDKNIQILEVYRDDLKGILTQSETTSAWFPFISEGQRTALNYSKDNIDFSGILSFLLYYSLFCLEKSMIKKDLATRQAMTHNLLNISEKISIPQNFFGSGKLHGFINFNTQIANYVRTSEMNFENLESAPVYDLNAEFFQKMLRRIRDFSRLDLGPFYYIGKDEKIYRAD